VVVLGVLLAKDCEQGRRWGDIKDRMRAELSILKRGDYTFDYKSLLGTKGAASGGGGGKEAATARDAADTGVERPAPPTEQARESRLAGR